MTIKEALKSTVNFNLPDNRIEKALIDADLIATGNYTKADEQAVDLCMAGLLLTLITSADLTEDYASIKLPSRGVLISAYAILRRKWGMPDETIADKPKPSVKYVNI